MGGYNVVTKEVYEADADHFEEKAKESVNKRLMTGHTELIRWLILITSGLTILLVIYKHFLKIEWSKKYFNKLVKRE